MSDMKVTETSGQAVSAPGQKSAGEIASDAFKSTAKAINNRIPGSLSRTEGKFATNEEKALKTMSITVLVGASALSLGTLPAAVGLLGVMYTAYKAFEHVQAAKAEAKAEVKKSAAEEQQAASKLGHAQDAVTVEMRGLQQEIKNLHSKTDKTEKDAARNTILEKFNGLSQKSDLIQSNTNTRNVFNQLENEVNGLRLDAQKQAIEQEKVQRPRREAVSDTRLDREKIRTEIERLSSEIISLDSSMDPVDAYSEIRQLNAQLAELNRRDTEELKEKERAKNPAYSEDSKKLKKDIKAHKLMLSEQLVSPQGKVDLEKEINKLEKQLLEQLSQDYELNNDKAEGLDKEKADALQKNNDQLYKEVRELMGKHYGIETTGEVVEKAEPQPRPIPPRADTTQPAAVPVRNRSNALGQQILEVNFIMKGLSDDYSNLDMSPEKKETLKAATKDFIEYLEGDGNYLKNVIEKDPQLNQAYKTLLNKYNEAVGQ